MKVRKIRKSYLLFALSTLLVSHVSWAYPNGTPKISSSDQDEIWTTGHRSPDTDSQATSKAAAHFYGYKAGRTGGMNPESKFIFETFSVEYPELIVGIEGKDFFLVDHNVRSQGPDRCMEDSNIIGILDHHPTQDGSYYAIDITIKKWGATASIMASKYHQSGRAIPYGIAGILMGAILSDTDNLTSETTTNHDKFYVNWLATVVGYDKQKMDEFYGQMAIVKSDFSGVDAETVLLMDYKEYNINGYAVGYGVAATIDPDSLFARKDEIIATMIKVKEDPKRNLDHIYFAVTDTRKATKGSTVFTSSAEDHQFLVEAFDGLTYIDKEDNDKVKPAEIIIGDDTVTANPITSRKRQMMPAVEDKLESQIEGSFVACPEQKDGAK